MVFDMKLAFLLFLMAAILGVVPCAACAEETFAPIPFDLETGVSVDLDGDGSPEEISLKEVMGPYDEKVICAAVRGANGAEAEHFTEIHTLTHAWVADLDPADGIKEVLVSGDVMSSDYCTWVLRWKGDAFDLLPYANGDPEFGFEGVPGDAIRVEAGSIIMEDSVDMLGTWWGQRPFRLTEDGRQVAEVPEANWTFEYDFDDPAIWERCLELKRELPYTDADGAAAVLPAGTRLQIVETDGEQLVCFRTEDGAEGSFTASPSDKGWGFAIDGIDESEWFVETPYAG